MSATKKALVKIPVYGDQSFYLLSTFEDEGEAGFDLSVTDGTNAWTGSVSEATLKKLCQEIKMDYSEYVSQTRKALTQENIGSFNFQYVVGKAAGTSKQFIWKKHIAAENIKFQLGSAVLKQMPEPLILIRSIFAHAIDSAGGYQEQITALQSTNERLTSERATALKRLEKCVRAKEEMEQELYEKFVAVLNKKKSKIRSMMQEIEDFQAAGPSESSAASDAQAGTSRSKAARPLADSGDESDDDRPESKDTDSEYHTDEDAKVTSHPSKKVKVKDGSGGAAGDGSLLLDDGMDVDDDPITTTRRRRRQPSAKKQTPSKPVIPRVPSGVDKITPTTSRGRGRRTASMQKSTSSQSKSSDYTQLDDLIGDM